MDLVTARITQLCDRLKLGTISAEWPAIARDAASGHEASFARVPGAPAGGGSRGARPSVARGSC